jgi:hypothetical protein
MPIDIFLEWIEAHERMARWFILMDHRMQADVDYVGGINNNDYDDDDSEDYMDDDDDNDNVVNDRSCPTEW